MKSFFTTLVLLFSLNSFGQYIVFDTTQSEYPTKSSNYYKKTNFRLIDSLELWNYSFDLTFRGRESDSIKPIGQITFFRLNAIDDGISKNLYKRLWTPYITFDIYNIKNKQYCYNSSNRTRFFSSCVPPNVGGDIIIMKDFIFLNHSVCLSCQRYDTKTDYCRPVINYIFSQVNKRKITSLETLFVQFPISKFVKEKE